MIIDEYKTGRITTDTDALTLKITFKNFMTIKNEDGSGSEPYPIGIKDPEKIEFFYDMKNGIIDLGILQDDLDDFWLHARASETLGKPLVKKAYKRLLNLAEIFTGISFESYRTKEKLSGIWTRDFNKLVRLPFCPGLYYIILRSKKNDGFHYDRKDPEIFNHFCKAYKIRHIKSLRRVFPEKPWIIYTYFHLRDCGFRDINLYNQVITNKEKTQKIDEENPKALAFFCRYSIKKRGEKATLNTILRKKDFTYELEGADRTFSDGLQMFAKYFRHIPQSLRQNILRKGFTETNHAALSNIAYRCENKRINFSYTDEEKALEDEIDGYLFRLPKTSYQLCEIANTLHNCAASYVDKVQKKDCTIVYAEKDGKYRICIEVQGNEIIQERIHHNKDPEKEERTALRKWHKKHKLTIQKPQELDEEAAIARLRQPRRARELRQYIPE